MRQAFYTSKFYISKKSEKEVCFKLNFEIEISGGGEKIYQFPSKKTSASISGR
ncbi:hypothetical protein ACFVIQ_08475 [Campylobacter coli]|uniref:hypothetical protein n=1 Tax=Campylobacter coli TaxID=195 RepID=UPI0025815712|nr:hypothetical protein I11999_19130 [Campylobacter coli]GMM09613.1 hypothetical protein I12399_17800 [Campylobacter coli]